MILRSKRMTMVKNSYINDILEHLCSNYMMHASGDVNDVEKILQWNVVMAQM